MQLGILCHLYITEINRALIPLLLTIFNAIVFDYLSRQKLGGINLTYNYLKQFPVLYVESYSHISSIEYILPRAIELIYTSWDVKPLADDVWNDAAENLREAIQRQWEENQEETGGHEDTKAPEWLDIIYSLSAQSISKTKIPFPPFKWDEERRAQLKAELDAYYAQLYGLSEQELCYILDPKDVYGSLKPGKD